MLLNILLLFFNSIFSSSYSYALSFDFIGNSPKAEFHEVFERASKRLDAFTQRHSWKKQVSPSKHIKKIEIYSSKVAFDKKLIQLSEGRIKAVPSTHVGIADKGILRVVSWAEYKKIHPQDSLVDYEKLLTHEMAHQLHIELLDGNEDLMGPVWFFEGFAALAADQYPDFKMSDRQKMKEVIQSSKRGDYKVYAAILRELVKLKSLPDLVDMAKGADFNSEVLKIFR